MKVKALLFATVLGTLLWSSCVLAAPVGFVQEAVGDVKIICEDEAVNLASVEAPIQQNDTITTGPGSRAQIMFQDKTVLALGENSELKVYSVLSEFGSGATSMGILKGTLRVLTSKVVSQNPDKFLVESPLGVIGIRGTEFACLVDADKETHALLEGGPVVYTTTQPLGGDYAQTRDDLCVKAFEALSGYEKALEVYENSNNIGSTRRMERKIRDLRAVMYENKCVAP